MKSNCLTHQVLSCRRRLPLIASDDTLDCLHHQVLERWIPAAQLEAIYVNHPEPPQQAAAAAAAAAAALGSPVATKAGSGGIKGGGSAAAAAAAAAVSSRAPEAAHMLTPRLFTAAAAALKPGGRLTIVTDNLWCASGGLGWPLMASDGL